VLRAEQIKTTGFAQAAALTNPILSAGLFGAAKSIEANIQAIKASTGASIGKVAAIGLAQGAAIGLSGGGSSGGGSGGGGSSASTSSAASNSDFISRQGEANLPQAVSGDAASSRFGRGNNPLNVTVIGNVDKKGIAFAVEEGKREIRASRVGQS